jgi:hypothetical protein
MLQNLAASCQRLKNLLPVCTRPLNPPKLGIDISMKMNGALSAARPPGWSHSSSQQLCEDYDPSCQYKRQTEAMHLVYNVSSDKWKGGPRIQNGGQTIILYHQNNPRITTYWLYQGNSVPRFFTHRRSDLREIFAYQAPPLFPRFLSTKTSEDGQSFLRWPLPEHFQHFTELSPDRRVWQTAILTGRNPWLRWWTIAVDPQCFTRILRSSIALPSATWPVSAYKSLMEVGLCKKNC